MIKRQNQVSTYSILLAGMVLLMPGCSDEAGLVKPKEEPVEAEQVQTEQGEVEIAIPSEPLDPWSLPAPTVDTRVVFLPMVEEGKINLDNQDLPLYLVQSWGYYTPSNVGVNEWFGTVNLFESMQAYSPNRSYPLDESSFETLTELLGATHVVMLSREHSDHEDVYTIVLDHHDNKLTGTVTVGAGEEFKAMAEINRWLIDAAELELSEKNATALVAPYLGRDYQRDDELPEDFLSWPYESDNWAKALEESPGIDTWKVIRANAMVGQENKAALLEIAGGPLPAGSSPVDRFIRAKCLYYAEQYKAAYHEYSLIIAEHPGKQFYVSRLFFDRMKKEHKDAAAVEAFQKWHDRSPASNVVDWYQAEFLNDVAWALRGGGYADSVDPSVWPIFHKYVNESKQLFEKVLADEVQIPYIVQNYISTIGASNNNPQQVRELAETVTKQYPDAYMVWNAAIHYNRPRWGGKHEVAMDMLDQAMDRAPNNPNIANLVYTYHNLEARDFQGNSHPFYALRAWTESNPRHQAQRDRAFEILLNAEPKEKCTARAFYFAVAFYDEEGRRRAYQAMPDRNFLDYFYLCPAYRFMEYSFSIPRTMLEYGEWDHLEAFFVDLEEYEENYRFANVERRFKKPMGDDVFTPYFKSFILMSKGDRDGAIALLDHDPVLRVNYSFFYLWAKVAMDDIKEGDVEAGEKILAEISQKNPSDSEMETIMAACVNRRAGNLERCQELVALYQKEFPEIKDDLFFDNYRHYAETGREFIWD